MPAPINVLRTGTGWTIDVTSLQLNLNLGEKDFLPRHSGVTVGLANYTKTNANLLTYVGAAVPSNTPIQMFRDSSRLVPDFVFGTLNSSSQLNTAFVFVERIIEDQRQMLTTLGF